MLDPQLTSRTHFAYPDGVRGTLALFVVVAHAYWIVWPLEYGRQPSPGLRPWLSPLLYSRFAITVFIVLSGFCLSLAVIRNNGVLRGGTWTFFRGRARRILPPFFAALMLSLVLIWTVIGSRTGTAWDRGLSIDWHGYLGNLLLVQNLVGTSQINGTFWTIGAEWQVYLFFPLLVLIWRLAGIVTATAVGIAGAVAGVAMVDRLGDHGHVLPGAAPIFLALFAMGMFGAVTAFSEEPMFVRLRERVPWVVIAVAASASIAALDGHWGIIETIRHWPYLDFLGGLATMSILISASRLRRAGCGPASSSGRWPSSGPSRTASTSCTCRSCSSSGSTPSTRSDSARQARSSCWPRSARA